ncbi:hypothetical protein KUCAC02_018670 [Chaenocephalus aceratus]|uniref:Uncharacterized protein n=1 Tax=Chaenocephalus aceratus TaxID=36190 RepID=A0ACB9W965_CHAAC|nr:hypothetical protein KUCAC02_018670 [Chaenocephalus aceratus]
MARRDSGDGRMLLCLGVLLVASSFSHCARLTKPKALATLRRNSTSNNGQAKGSEQHHGRLLIGLHSQQGTTKNLLDADADYQDDMASGEGYSKQNREAVERLLKMEPKVECTVNSMRLEVQDAASTPGSLFFVDRGSGLSPLPLSKLPQSCGYTIRSTRRDLVVVAPYDGCFVAVEENYYVLPLRWYGLPVRMSCPMMKQSSPDPPRVTCHDRGMIVKTSWIVPVDGNWEPLMKASARCGFSVILHPEGAVISVRYAPCLGIKDGMYTLELAGEGETKISCPSLSAVSEFPGKPYQGSEDIKGPKLPQPAAQDTKAPTTVQPSQKSIPFIALSTSQPESDNSQEQLQQPFYPSFPYYPQPQPEKPTAPPIPPQPDFPQGQVHQPFPHYPQPVPEKPTSAPKPPQPDAPQGPVQQPFFPLPYYPQPETEQPTAAPKPPQPDDPQGPVQQPFFPLPYYPQPETETANCCSQTSPANAPQGSVQYPQPEAEQPTAAPKPPQPNAPQGPVQQPFYPFPYDPLPAPNQPTAAPKPPQPDAPQGPVQQPFYPFPHYPSARD